MIFNHFNYFPEPEQMSFYPLFCKLSCSSSS